MILVLSLFEKSRASFCRDIAMILHRRRKSIFSLSILSQQKFSLSKLFISESLGALETITYYSSTLELKLVKETGL